MAALRVRNVTDLDALLSDPAPTILTVEQLTDEEIAILDFETLAWNHSGTKEQDVLERFGVSMVRYWQIVNGLIDRPAALAYDPLLVRRLQRLRDARVAARAAR